MNRNAINESDLFLVAAWDLPPGLAQARWLLWAMVALSQRWLDVCLLSEWCLRDVLQIASHPGMSVMDKSQGRVLHGRPVCLFSTGHGFPWRLQDFLCLAKVARKGQAATGSEGMCLVTSGSSLMLLEARTLYAPPTLAFSSSRERIVRVSVQWISW